MSTVIVSGAIANKCLNGGEAWVRLSYVCGLRKLGFKVYFVEQINGDDCVGPNGASARFEQSTNLAYFKSVVDQFGLSDSSVLTLGGEQTFRLPFEEVLKIAESTDLLINITGHLRLEPFLRRIRRKMYIDLDPGFTQFWHEAGNTGAHLEGHDFYFTVGENIGAPGLCEFDNGLLDSPSLLDFIGLDMLSLLQTTVRSSAAGPRMAIVVSG